MIFIIIVIFGIFFVALLGVLNFIEDERISNDFNNYCDHLVPITGTSNQSEMFIKQRLQALHKAHCKLIHTKLISNLFDANFALLTIEEIRNENKTLLNSVATGSNDCLHSKSN